MLTHRVLPGRRGSRAGTTQHKHGGTKQAACFQLPPPTRLVHHVEAARELALQHLLERLLPVVDHAVAAQRPEVQQGRAGRAGQGGRG